MTPARRGQIIRLNTISPFHGFFWSPRPRIKKSAPFGRPDGGDLRESDSLFVRDIDIIDQSHIWDALYKNLSFWLTCCRDKQILLNVLSCNFHFFVCTHDRSFFIFFKFFLKIISQFYLSIHKRVHLQDSSIYFFPYLFRPYQVSARYVLPWSR